MIHSEITKVLTRIATAHPGWNFGEADVEHWFDTIGELGLDEALAAVREHYREQTRWIMPADVLGRAKAARRSARATEDNTRVLAAAKRAPVAPNVDYEVAAAQLRIDSASRNAAMRVSCRHCKAGVGSQCVIYPGGPALTALLAHHVRMEDAGLPAPTPVLPEGYRDPRPGDELARLLREQEPAAAIEDEPVTQPEREPRPAFDDLDPDDWRNDDQTDADDPGG